MFRDLKILKKIFWQSSHGRPSSVEPMQLLALQLLRRLFTHQVCLCWPWLLKAVHSNRDLDIDWVDFPLCISDPTNTFCIKTRMTSWPPCRLPIAGGHNLRLLGLGPGQVQGGRSLNIHQLSLQQSFSPSSCPWFIPGLPWQRKTGRNSLPHLLPTHGRWWLWFCWKWLN